MDNIAYSFFSLGYDMALREDSLRIPDFDNLFCAGDKAGTRGVQSGINTGYLAGHNAVRAIVGKELVVLPRTTTTGDFIAFNGEWLRTEERLVSEYILTFGAYLRRLKDLGLFPVDEDKAREEIEKAGLTGVLAQKLV